MTTVKIDINKISKAAKESFKDACLIGHREIIKVISEEGAFPSHPSSDIVDTGLLRASQQPPVFSDGDKTATFTNSVEYAIYVHEGYTTKAGNEVKGRPWLKEGLKRAKLAEVTQKILNSKL